MYLDNAATTPILPEVQDIVSRYGLQQYYNPSALYRGSVDVNRDVAAARQTLAKALGCDAECITYTSCGTEADNQALFCTRKKNGARIIISAVEHSAVYNSAMELRQRGYDVQVCAVDAYGRVDYDDFVRLLTPDTALVSVMHVNNETGAVNDIARLVQTVKQCNPDILFHSDGVQALGHIKVNVRTLGVDLYAVSGHKIGAPKGIGALYCKKGVHLAPLLYGGGQEKGLRSGTENVIGIVALAACCRRYLENQPVLQQKGAELRDTLQRFVAAHPDYRMLTPADGAMQITTICGNVVRGEVMMHALEEKGIMVGIGSACSTKKGIKRIPAALGLKDGYEMGLLRLSVNPFDHYDWDKLYDDMHAAYQELSKYLRN